MARKTPVSNTPTPETPTPRTLAIDIGATGLKAAVLDAGRALIAPRVRVDTPKPATPEAVVEALLSLVQSLEAFDRISIGFPGVVRADTVLTAPNLAHDAWPGYALATVLADRLGKPARMLNDATVHGLGVIEGKGLECVLTLGTGMGFALFEDGRLTPHLELSHHPVSKGRDYDAYIGDIERKRIGVKRWNKRLAFALDCVRGLTGYDTLLIGGGNTRHIRLTLAENIRVVPAEAGLTGGVRLWDKRMAPAFSTGEQA